MAYERESISACQCTRSHLLISTVFEFFFDFSAKYFTRLFVRNVTWYTIQDFVKFSFSFLIAILTNIFLLVFIVFTYLITSVASSFIFLNSFHFSPPKRNRLRSFRRQGIVGNIVRLYNQEYVFLFPLWPNGL